MSGAKIQKPGEGMPNYENNKIRGTLYITVDVKFPKRAFSEQDSEGMILFLLCGIIFGLLKLGLVSPPSASLLASFPGSCAWAEKKEPGTHCLCMLRISGNLEIFRKTCSLTLTSSRHTDFSRIKDTATDYALCRR